MLLKFAIKDFIEDRKLKNLSKQSIKSYTNTLNQFGEFSIDNGIVNIEDVTYATIKSYLIFYKEEKNNKATSINHKIRNLKIFFQYFIDEEVIPEKKNPMKKIQYLTEDIEIGTFTDNQIKQMLNYFRKLKSREKTYYAVRDYLVVIFLLGTGVRLGELANAKWKDADLKNRSIIIFGKKRQQRTITLNPKLTQELKEFFIYKSQLFKENEESKYIFTSIANEKLTENAISLVFKRLKEVMNFQDVRLSAHTFRHTFAKNWIMAGGDVFSLQKILGHSKLEMTQKYVELFGSDLKEQNDKYNPLNFIEL